MKPEEAESFGRVPRDKFIMGVKRKSYLKHRKARIEDVRARRKKDPIKHKAQYRLSNAIASGKVKRKPCEVCANPKSEGHHPDYNEPFSVAWLCKKHHAEHHKNTPKK